MAMWHCPHCGVPQAETARCWVCHRSSTTCSTCRHFRRAVSAEIGYCALDARRHPMTGLEIRGCWEQGIAEPDQAPPAAVESHRLGTPATPWPATPHGANGAVAPRDFVPLELLGQLSVPVVSGPAAVEPKSGAPAAHPPIVIPEPDADWTERTSLFGDGER